MASQKNKWDSSPHYKYFYAFPAMKMFPPYRAKHLQHMGFRGTTSSPEKSGLFLLIYNKENYGMGKNTSIRVARDRTRYN